MTLLPPTACLVLVETEGTLGWLGQFADIASAQRVMEEWLKSDGRLQEDAAFILPILGFSRPTT